MVNLKSGLARIYERVEEPLSHRLEWTIKIRGDTVRFAELEVRAPFRAESCYIHECQPCADCEAHILRLRPVYFERWAERGWGIALFVGRDKQPGLIILLNDLVSNAVKASHASQARQVVFKSGLINRFPGQGREELLHIG